MSNPRFCRFELRTTAPAAAGEFYEAVLGHRGDAIVTLPPSAAAQGAPPHWLGLIDVAAIGGSDAVAERFVARGASRLGPTQEKRVLLRDPGGAIVALTDMATASCAGVGLHQLHTADAERAVRNYAELFGWALTDRLELGLLGIYQRFAWDADGPNVGTIADIEGRAELHPHWLFFFGVPALDGALAEVDERATVVLGSTLLPNGSHVAVCEDPQGAAFGLIESAPSS